MAHKIAHKHVLTVALALSLTVGGCYRAAEHFDFKGYWESDAKRTSHHDMLKFGPHGHHLSHKHHAQLKALIAKATLDTPVYARLMFLEPHTHAKDSAVLQRVRALKDCLVKLGIERHRIEVFFADPATVLQHAHGDKHTVTVSIDQYEVIPPKCPGWSKTINGTTSPEGELHFGCTSEVNTAQMIAEPRDLYRAEDLGERDGTRNAVAVRRYRQGATQALKQEKSDAGSSAAKIEGDAATSSNLNDY